MLLSQIVSGDPLESEVNGRLKAADDPVSDKPDFAVSSRVPSPGYGMYPRQECIKQASVCREKARADPDRYDYWIDEAVAWHQRAIETGGNVAATHEVRDGQMIAKQPR